MKEYNRGSEWRKWDLQVHTPFSVLNNQFGNDWDKYVHDLYVNAIKNEIAVIGITDYYSIDGYEKIKKEYLSDEIKLANLFADEIQRDEKFLSKVYQIKLLPNIEFRFEDIVVINEHDNKIEGHFIFSDEVSIEDIKNKFLSKILFMYQLDGLNIDKTPLIKSNIEDLGKKIKEVQPTFKESDYVVGLNCLTIDFTQVMEILTKDLASIFKNKYIFIIPEDDITKIKWNSGAHMVRKKFYTFADGIFTTNEKTINWGLTETTKNEFHSYKPAFSCSDAHKLSDFFVFKSNKPCWIKADPTFSGLQQVLFQPKERIYIGDCPKKLVKENQEKYYYMDRIVITKNIAARNKTTWFNTDLPLNSGLIAIIGNKGSGKSALADIIGYLVNSKNISKASFLNNQRFRKEDNKYADDYQAKLFWRDSRKDEYNTLNDSPNGVQTAEYLPQKFIDEVCNELNDSFQQEIDNVIFSYIDTADKLEISNFKELLQKKTQDIEFEIKTYKNNIETLINDLINIEDKLTEEYKENIKNKLKQKKDILESHKNSKPKKVIEPSIKSEVSKEIEDLNTKLISIEEEIIKHRDQLLAVNLEIDDINQFINKYKLQVKQFGILSDEANELYKKYNINKSFTIRIESSIDNFEQLLCSLINEKEQINIEIKETDNYDEEHGKLIKERNKLKAQIQKYIEDAEIEEKQYQTYLVNLRDWEDKEKVIIGDKNIEDSIKYYENELDYIENVCIIDYEKICENILENIKNIYDANLKKMDIYKKIYTPIEEKLHNIIHDNVDNIQFETVLKLNKSFSTIFLSYIRQNVDSIFKGVVEGLDKINQIVRECDFLTWDGFKHFIIKIYTSIASDKNKLQKLVPNREVCYNYIAKLEYLDIKYSLKLDGKSLDELSPGQRGNVLLIFYLALSKNSCPLIIDQPEDNLDNQSVYNKLVPCILEAKKNRQVIIVTHNPNIAVACDAEQIICAKMDKKTNSITYQAGSIENENIRQAVIDILEGTMPAFELRRIKYLTN